MVYFQTKNPNVGKFWRVSQWKLLVYFMTIWSILCTAIWYILLQSGTAYGNLVSIFPVLVICAKKNLATLKATAEQIAMSSRRLATGLRRAWRPRRCIVLLSCHAPQKP
jgi:hypothetical protein